MVLSLKQMFASDTKTGSDASNRMRKPLAVALKFLISAALVFALFYYQVISIEALRTTFRDPVVALSAFAVLLLGYGLSALRWYFLLQAMGITVRLRPSAEIFAMGTFATTFLPGGTGGDLLRAVYVARHVHQDRTGGIISVMVDRAVGLLGVITAAVLLGFSRAEHVIASPATKIFFYALVATLAGAIIGITAALIILSPTRVERIRAFVGARTIVHRSVLRFLETVVQLRADPMRVGLSAIISIAVTMTIVSSVVLLAHGYESGGLTDLDFANAAVLAFLVNAVPVTPGGIGVAEGAFAFICHTWELLPTVLPYGTIFFGYRIILTVISLFGSVAFVTYSRGRLLGDEPRHSGLASTRVH